MGKRSKLRKGRGQQLGWSSTKTGRDGGKGPGRRISLGEIPEVVVKEVSGIAGGPAGCPLWLESEVPEDG